MPASYNTPHCTYPTPSWLLQALPCRRPKAPSSLLAPAGGMTGSDVCVEFVGWRVPIDHKHAGARIREPGLAITGIRGSARSAASVPCAQGVCICTAWPPSIKTTTGMRCCVGVAGRPRAGRRSRAARSLVLTILARAASTCLPSTPSPAPQYSPLATTTAPQPVRFRRLAALAALVVSCGRQRVRGRRRSFGKECACPAAERRGASATYALCHRSSGRPAGRTQALAGKASRFWRRLGWSASSMWPNNALVGSRCRWCCITAVLVDPTAA